MSLNRELVLYYITYKLSQRNYPLDHIQLCEGERTDSANGTEAGATVGARTNGRVNGSTPSPLPVPADTPSVPESTDTPSVPTSLPDPTDTSSPLSAADVPTASPPSPRQRPAGAPSAAAPPVADLSAVKEALRDSANEFELRFSRAFSDLHRQLHITPATAYRSFESVMDEVFRDGVNWGRVVGLFAFGGALCVECVEKEMSPLVSRIVEWMTLYLDNHIQDWITSQGGWARFAEIYGADAAAHSRRSEENLKKWLWAGMTLVTGVVVGSLIAHKRL